MELFVCTQSFHNLNLPTRDRALGARSFTTGHQLTTLTAADSLDLAHPFWSVIKVFRDLTEQDTELYVLVEPRFDQFLCELPYISDPSAV